MEGRCVKKKLVMMEIRRERPRYGPLHQFVVFEGSQQVTGTPCQLLGYKVECIATSFLNVGMVIPKRIGFLVCGLKCVKKIIS